MAPRYIQTPQTPKRKTVPLSQLIGERRDAKHESPLCDGVGAVRRSMTQELMADRKR